MDEMAAKESPMEREGIASSEGHEALSDKYMVNIYQLEKRSSRFGNEWTSSKFLFRIENYAPE